MNKQLISIIISLLGIVAAFLISDINISDEFKILLGFLCGIASVQYPCYLIIKHFK